MKKKIVLILLCLLFVPYVKAYENFSPEDIPTSTYIIGNYMFTRDKNDDYDGTLTTKMIMLASKTIEGSTLDDMIIYYRKVNGDWIDGLTGTNVDLPEFFGLANVNLQTWGEFSRKTYYDTKEVNGKTLNIEYRLNIGDTVTGDLYINDNLVIERIFNITECGYGACLLSENIEALNNFKPSDIESGIINGDKEYLYFVSKSIQGTMIIAVDDTGNLIFSKGSSSINPDVYDDCADKEFLENVEKPYLFEKGTPDILYYVATSDDELHKSRMKVIFENNQAVETKINTCTSKTGMLAADLEWYEETKTTKTLNVDGQMKDFTIGYYPTYHNPKGNEITFDLFYDDMLIYSTKYVGTSEDEFDRYNMLEIANQYKLGTIAGESNDENQEKIDYLYLTELKENDVSGGATYITILDHLEEGFDIRTFGPIASIKVSEAGQGITPLETHPRYNNYLETGGLSYCVIGNEIYYLVQAPGTEDKAVELKISIGKNGQINQENLGLVDVTIEGAI